MKNSVLRSIILTNVEKLFCLMLSGCAFKRRSEILVVYHAVGDDPLWEFARRNGSESIVGAVLLNVLGKEDAPERWVTAAKETESKISSYLEQLDCVATALAKEGIPLVALKNSGIARGIYRDLAGSPMGDIDVLVRPSDFRKAHGVMLGLNFELGDRSPFGLEDIETAERHGGAEYTTTLADGNVLWFELQWRPVAGRWIQPNQEPPADELIARSVPIEGTAARLLSPEDNLLQVCLHTAKHSFVRAPGFRLHTDVDRIVRGCEIDWGVFCSRVEEMTVRTAVYLSLVIPVSLMATPVPSDVLDRLNHAPAKHRLLEKWLLKVGLFDPEARKWSKLGYIFFNLMLYDAFGGIVRAVFPDSDWMLNRYGAKRRWSVPFLYLTRMAELLLKRANT